MSDVSMSAYEQRLILENQSLRDEIERLTVCSPRGAKLLERELDRLAAAIKDLDSTIARLEAGQSATASLERWRHE